MTENRDSPQWLLLGGTLFSLVAFAANSIFCRLALKSAHTEAEVLALTPEKPLFGQVSGRL